MFLKNLRASDLVLTAGLSVIIGLIFMFWAVFVYPVATAIGGPIGYALIYGMWFIGGTIPAYIIRKPGIAFLGEFIGAHVELLTGSPYGVTLVYYGITQGLMAELIFFSFRFHRCDNISLMLAGALPAIPAYLADYFIWSYETLSLQLQIATFVCMLLSGAVIAGLFAKFFIDKIADTGIFDLFPIRNKDGW